MPRSSIRDRPIRERPIRDWCSQHRRRLTAAGACLLVVGAPPSFGGASDASPPSADKVKAAYLYNFAKFVNWPGAGATDSLVMCILGAPGVYGFLAHDVNGTLLGQRSVAVRSIGPAESRDDCSMVYLEAAAGPARASAPGASLHALTVSDQQNFLRNGGIIELFEEGNRFRFNISLTNARSAGLKISAQLLQLAAKVEAD